MRGGSVLLRGLRESPEVSLWEPSDDFVAILSGGEDFDPTIFPFDKVDYDMLTNEGDLA